MYVWQSWYKQYSKIITTKMLRFSPFFCLCWFSHERLPFLHLPAFSVTTFCLPISPQLLHVFFCLILLFSLSFSHDFDLSLFSLLISLPLFSVSLSLSVYLSPKALSGGAAVEGGGRCWILWTDGSAVLLRPPPIGQSMPSFQFWPSPANRGINKLLAPFCQL